jgi:hypothetical protein
MGQNTAKLITLVVTILTLAVGAFVTTPASAQSCDPNTDPLCVDYDSVSEELCIGTLCVNATSNQLLILLRDVLGFMIDDTAPTAGDVGDQTPTPTATALPPLVFPPYIIQTLPPEPTPTVPIVPTTASLTVPPLLIPVVPSGPLAVPPLLIPVVPAATPRSPLPPIDYTALYATPPAPPTPEIIGLNNVEQASQYARSMAAGWSAPIETATNRAINGGGGSVGIVGQGQAMQGLVERFGNVIALVRAIQFYAPNTWPLIAVLLVGVAVLASQRLIKFSVALIATAIEIARRIWQAIPFKAT